MEVNPKANYYIVLYGVLGDGIPAPIVMQVVTTDNLPACLQAAEKKKEQYIYLHYQESGESGNGRVVAQLCLAYILGVVNEGIVDDHLLSKKEALAAEVRRKQAEAAEADAIKNKIVRPAIVH